MRRRFVLSIVGLSFLLGWAVSGQSRPSQVELRAEIEYLLRWRGFWKGSDSFKDYHEGKTVEAAIVEAPGDLSVFIAEVGIAFHFQLEDGRIVKARLQQIGDDGNASAVKRFISDYAGKPGFVLTPGAVPSDPKLQVRQEQRGDKKGKPVLIETIFLELPELAPRLYNLTRPEPEALSYLEASVSSRVAGFYDASCGRGEIVIPMFSAKDPAVYVYGDLGKCGKGIFPFIREASGGVMPGQFSPDKPPNQWSLTIRRIHENVVTRIPLPMK